MVSMKGLKATLREEGQRSVDVLAVSRVCLSRSCVVARVSDEAVVIMEPAEDPNIAGFEFPDRVLGRMKALDITGG